MSSETSRHHRQVGEYELLEKIGQGGMSTVYKARHLRKQNIVAIKLASRVVVNDSQLSRRFELEFSLVHPLKHKHLVKVLESGVHDKAPFLVMEFVDGQSLSEQLKQRGHLSEHDALPIVLEVAEALKYLHKKQIIHRDIKPANILLTAEGQVKLADLGLVKHLDSLSRLTRSNIGLGTMHFASPEQFDDASTADARSDIYSLAATLYLMLTGDYPFGNGPALTVLGRKLKNQFEAPIGKVPELRPCIDAAIRMGLHAERAERPESIGEFVSYLTGEKKVPNAATLPGTLTEAKARAVKEKKTGKERRLRVRYEVELEAGCRAVANAGGKRWPAWIIDISTTGLCLHAQRRFEANSVIDISMATAELDSLISLLARVRWIRSTETKTWLLGCEFVKSFSDDDLNSIFAYRLDKTRILKE